MRARRLRRLVATGLVGSVLVVGAGCGGNSDKSSDASGRKAGSASQSDDAGNNDDVTTATVSDDEFTKSMTAVRDKIEGSDGDICVLSAALGAVPPDPANAGQMKLFGEVYVVMLNKIAETLGANTDNGKALTEAAGKFAARLEEGKYDPKLIDDEILYAVMNTPAMQDALLEFGKQTEDCDSSGDAG